MFILGLNYLVIAVFLLMYLDNLSSLDNEPCDMSVEPPKGALISRSLDDRRT